MRQVVYLFLVLSLSTITAFEEQSESNGHYYSNAELEQMLAPIALYPDSILTHILIASTYPLEIIQANRWISSNPEIDTALVMDLLEEENWDPSVKALVPFPKILERLSQDLDWTLNLGDAFLQDESRVLASIQSLRYRADEAGSLDNIENMEVYREDDNIIIQPVEREVVYVPYYDTRVIYGTWHWLDYPPVYWNWNNHHHYTNNGLYYWDPGVHLAFNYFFGAFHWHNRHIIVIDRHRYRSAHHYRRHNMIANSDARRWNHNPRHRRGVAYRSEQVRNRYKSNRHSSNQSLRTHRKKTIHHENRGVANKQPHNKQRNRKVRHKNQRQDYISANDSTKSLSQYKNKSREKKSKGNRPVSSQKTVTKNSNQTARQRNIISKRTRTIRDNTNKTRSRPQVSNQVITGTNKQTRERKEIKQRKHNNQNIMKQQINNNKVRTLTSRQNVRNNPQENNRNKIKVSTARNKHNVKQNQQVKQKNTNRKSTRKNQRQATNSDRKNRSN